MARRLVAFALAFVVIGAPLTGDVCAVMCAEHAGHSIDTTVPVSHHHASRTPARLHITIMRTLRRRHRRQAAQR